MKTAETGFIDGNPGTIVGVLAVVWLSHVVLTSLGDPLGLFVDTILWILACLLKVVALTAILTLLRRVYRRIGGDSKRALMAFVIWGATGVTLVLLLALTHEQWARLLSNEAIKFHAIEQSPNIVTSVASHRSAWLASWKSGDVLISEAYLALLLAGFHACLGYFMGSRSRHCWLYGAALTIVTLTAYSLLFRRNLLDYDIFHGELFSGPLLADLAVFFFASDPYTTIGLVFYCGFVTSSLVLLRHVIAEESAA